MFLFHRWVVLSEETFENIFKNQTIVEADIKDSLMQDEIFGPVLPILTVKNMDEAIDIIKDGEKVKI